MSYLTSFSISQLTQILSPLTDAAFNGATATAVLQTLPITDAWNMDRVDPSGQVVGLVEGVVMVQSTGGGIVFSRQNGQGVAVFDGSAYLAGNTPFGAVGGEAWLEPQYRGFTCGCWVRLDSATGTDRLIARWAGSGNFSFLLQRHSGGTFRFHVSQDGTVNTLAEDVRPTVANTWYHIVGRFQPGQRVSTCLDGKWTHATVTYTNLYAAGGLNLRIGNDHDLSGNLAGAICWPFVAARALDDTQIAYIRRVTDPR